MKIINILFLSLSLVLALQGATTAETLQVIDDVILQQKSGVGVKPLFYYSNIPTHNSRVIYSHS